MGVQEFEMETWKREIGQRLRDEIRTRYGKKRESYFATDILEISQGSLADILNGNNLPSAYTLFRIVTQTNIDIIYLLKGE